MKTCTKEIVKYAASKKKKVKCAKANKKKSTTITGNCSIMNNNMKTNRVNWRRLRSMTMTGGETGYERGKQNIIKNNFYKLLS